MNGKLVTKILGKEEEVKKALISSGFTVIESEILEDWSVILLKKEK